MSRQNAPAGSSNREILENYFDNPCPTGILVMTVKSWPEKHKTCEKAARSRFTYRGQAAEK